MPRRALWLLFPVLALTCCASAGTSSAPATPSPPPTAATPAPAQPPAIPAETRVAIVTVPLVLDRADLALGTTVHFTRIPTPAELNDLEYTYGLARVVVSLESWPASFGEIEGLNRRPMDLETVVLLPGWPPTRAAAEAWNYVTGRVRVVVMVQGPPTDRGVIADLNAMRALERVVAQMDEPSRAGFERLQRPLSFRKVVR